MFFGVLPNEGGIVRSCLEPAVRVTVTRPGAIRHPQT